MREGYRFRGLEREKDIKVYEFKEREGGWVLERERERNKHVIGYIFNDIYKEIWG